MSDDPESITLRLRWRATWPDREADFVAEAPTYNGNVGRIYYVPENHGMQSNRWFWAFQAFGDDVNRGGINLSGHEDTPRQAARRVEDAWFSAIRDGRHDVPVPDDAPKNAYAAAKGR